MGEIYNPYQKDNSILEKEIKDMEVNKKNKNDKDFPTPKKEPLKERLEKEKRNEEELKKIREELIEHEFGESNPYLKKEK